MQQVMTVYRESFVDVPVSLPLPSGLTLWEMSRRMPVASDFTERGTIAVDGQVIPSGVWHLVRPKPHVTVTMHLPAAGGGENGDGKAIFGMISSLALSVLGGWIAGGAFATASGLFAAGSLSASVLAASVSLVGSLLLSALAPPPVKRKATDSPESVSGASAEGNVLNPNGPVVRVIGQRRVFPPLASEPFFYFDGPDEVVEATYILAGPHNLSDIRVGSAALGDAGVEYELREGWPGDPPLTLHTRQSYTEAPQLELRAHLVDDSDNRTLDDSVGGTLNALPQASVLATRLDPDQHQFQIVFPQGLHKQGTTTIMRVPMRVRIRRRGDVNWKNLPEFHFQASRVDAIRASLIFQWCDSAAGLAPSASVGEGWCEVRRSCAGQTVAPETATYNADPYFGTTGDVYMSSSNPSTSGVSAVEMGRYTCTVYLERATFPPGQYEIEIKRGASFTATSYSSIAYTVNGVVWDFYGYQGEPALIVQARENVTDAVYIVRSVSVWDEHPLPTSDFAAVAVRARNRKVEELSILAGGYVPDWDGTDWRNWTVTSNPAPHLRDIYVGRLNVDPVENVVVDDVSFLDWRSRCATMGYECNALIEGGTVMEVSTIVAACGYARPRMSDRWGVVQDYSRRTESPVQIFTPNNMRDYSWTKAFARVPDGLRVLFDDEDADYQTEQMIILAPGNSDDTSRIEQIRYEGITNRAAATARAEYDQMQPQLRSCFHTFTASAEAIVCEQGDLIGIQHETIDETVGYGRIVDVELSSMGTVVAIVLDNASPVFGGEGFDAILDMGLVPDMGLIGVSAAGVAIRKADGTILVTSVSVDANNTFRLVLSETITSGIEVGLLVSFGRIGIEYLRLLVYSITPKDDFTASITAVDEAPELWDTWILASGAWNDSGVWDDDSFWQDAA